MPFEPSQLETRAPTQAHFALLMDGAGTRLAIPPGASLWLVEDPSQADKIFPLTLRKVSVKKLQFEMAGTLYEYKLVSAKPLSKHAMERLVKNRAGAPVKVQK